MRSSAVLAPVLLLFGLAGCGGQPDTPEARIAHARHENFEKIGKAFKAINEQVKKDAPDMAIVRGNSELIDTLAPQVATWFPAGSGPQDGIETDALAAVWTEPEAFRQATAKFVDEASKFHALAGIGNASALDQGVQALGGACKGCHDRFREKD